MNRALSFVFFVLLAGVSVSGGAADSESEPLRQIGAAKIDITPDYPVRLSGYAVRRKESEGVLQRLWAKAIAIGSDKEEPAILITVDNTGVPASVRNEVARRLQTKRGIKPERLAVCSTHTHAAPCLAGNLPTLFGEPLPPEHQAHIEHYTTQLIDALEKVALEALQSRKPARLSWWKGEAGFAANRRTKGRPVDHELPVLSVTDEKGKVRAIVASYACHCTTLGGDTNQICGDWAGYAQEYLERDHPGAVVLTTIGCGADANPAPRGTVALARKHGTEIEAAVNQVLSRTLMPIRGKLECRLQEIELPFDKLRSREEWESMARQTNYAGYYAQVNLAKLDRGEQLLTKLPYFVQTWSFGEDLAMIFLAGEVVVDYSLRLKKEFDATRFWVNAYANDVPCYVPSERILKEGGYEGGDAMIYYDKPGRLAPGVEDLIVGAVHELTPADFVFDEHKAEYPPPKSPQESLASMQTRADLQVELVGAEPLVVDPVAIDWGPDGKLWVVEMRDYPAGMNGKWKPGSRVKYLESTHHDGKYDKATVFLDNLPFATGVMAWRKGVLVCTAPDILYAEKEEGRKEKGEVVVRKIFSGFATENYQARVNGLSLGLDNWVYGANGLLGGIIRGEAIALANADQSKIQNPKSQIDEVDIRGRDFRMKPDSGEFEPASGLSQQGRVRDDWGNWFGCDNSTLAWHFPLPDHYIRRNPYVAAPSPRVSLASGADPNLLHPISRTLERFNDPKSANRTTSACGIGIYRDDLLGQEFYGNAFICEPVHNLVHRLALKSDGVTFTGPRAEEEQASEFLACRDNWFRPVQARTGPDGALWIVDMYRFVIEHPRWIPPERLAKLDVRAGDDKGRIYRVYPKGKKLRPIRDLTRLSFAELVAAVDCPNGTERDRIHQQLLCRWRDRGTKGPRDQGTKDAVRVIQRLATGIESPAVRLQALCLADGLNKIGPELLQPTLVDASPVVRAQAIRLAERYARSDNAAEWESGVLKATIDDEDMRVRFQLALSLGEWHDRQAGTALGRLALKDIADPWMRAAILSSATHQSAEILKTILEARPATPAGSEMISQLIATAVGENNSKEVAEVLDLIAPADTNHLESWQLSALGSLLDSLERRKMALGDLESGAGATGRLDLLFDWANAVAARPTADESLRQAAIRLLGRRPNHKDKELQILADLLSASISQPVQRAVLEAIGRSRSPQVPQLVLTGWKLLAPSLRQSLITLLLSREEWAQALLEAIGNGTVAASEISPAHRQQLLKNSNAEIRKKAEELWQANRPAARTEVLARYSAATSLTGDAAKGATIFGKNCATCHALGGQGQSVGPDLAALKDKTPADFLTAILDPNAAVEPRFIAYNVETKDGRSLTGVVNGETATTLTLVQAGGLRETILRSDIEEIRASDLSLMPEGLEQAMSTQDVADLIAYLRSNH
jgi:putative membrane-bound dehydrogenase-like protein